MKQCCALPLVILFCLLHHSGHAQDSTAYSRIYKLPDRLFSGINARAESITQKLSVQTKKYFARLNKQEKKLKKKLWRKDSLAAKELFGDVDARYESIHTSFTGKQNVYIGHLDSVQTALLFLEQYAPRTQDQHQNIRTIFTNYAQLQQKLNEAAAVNKFLEERRQYLQAHLKKLNFTRQLRKYQQQVYYYRAQVDEYKQILEEPSKLEAKLLQLAHNIPAFREFFSKHSALAGLFRLAGNNSAGTPIPGLQTRGGTQLELENRFGAGPDVSRAMQQNIQSAQEQLNQLKDKVNGLAENGESADPPGFKPNLYKTKNFWQRIELGANMQSARSNHFFPVTSDLALSAGYKLNSRSIIGVAASYKLGWGQNIRHIKLTHEGVGLRSFIDWKLKGSVYISGGFEYNYQQPFSSMRQLHRAGPWQKTGLAGVSKVIALQSKFFKTTKLQLLWDFLSYQQKPATQPLKFRVGYSFN